MYKKILPIFFALSCGLVGCHGGASDIHDHHDHGHGEAAAFGSEIELAPEMAERMGVRAEIVEATSFAEAIAATGRLETASEATATVVAPTFGTVRPASGISDGSAVRRGQLIATVDASSVAGGDQNAAARAAMEAARKEVERLRPLVEAGIVSRRDYQAAEAAYEQARAAYSPAASTTATAPIAGAVTNMVQAGQYVAAGEPIATIVGDGALRLRVDVPVRYASRVPALTKATVKTAEGRVVDLDSIGSRTGVMPSQGGYVPVTFALRNPGGLTPGASVSVWLRGGDSRMAIAVPREALSEQQGRYFVYRRIDEDCYEKLPVSIGGSDGRRVEITSGLSGGENIVVSGTTAIRLAETSAVAPEGHSHNH